MPSFTRKAIMEAFLKILDEKPLGKITIRDIVDECGINRNTFYISFCRHSRAARDDYQGGDRSRHFRPFRCDVV